MNIDWFVVVGLTISVLLFAWAAWIVEREGEDKRELGDGTTEIERSAT